MNRGPSSLPFLTVLACLLAWGGAACAADTPDGRPPAPPNSAEFRAAIEACAQSAAKDAQGHPARAAMDACMQARGYAPPRAKPGEHDRPPPPPPYDD